MKRPLLFFFIVFIAVLSLLAKFALPNYQKLKEINSKIRGEEAEIENVEKYLQELAKNFNLLKEKEVELSKIDVALPKNPDPAVLFDFMQKSASAKGLVLETVEILGTSNLKERENIKQTPVLLGLSGKYSDFKNFLTLLEKNARVIILDELSVSSQGREERAPSFELKIRVYSY